MNIMKYVILQLILLFTLKTMKTSLFILADEMFLSFQFDSIYHALSILKYYFFQIFNTKCKHIVRGPPVFILFYTVIIL